MAEGEVKAARNAPPPPALVTEIVKKYDEAQGHHRQFVEAYERRERAYRGVLEPRSDAAKWKHKQHPPYAFNLLETVIANTIEEGLQFTVRPSPQVNMPLEEAQKLLRQTDGLELLLRHEHRVDEMENKQRPFYLCMGIGGTGVGKTYWNKTTGRMSRQGVVEREVRDAEDNLLGTVPMIQDIHEEGVLRDHSTFEVVDPRDFILPESAKALQWHQPGGADWLIHRCWYNMSTLRMMQAGDFIKNVDMLGESLSFEGEYNDRETQLFNIHKNKGLIEVLEYWCFENGTVYRALVGNRKVLLREKEDSPFWHQEYPFVLGSSMPQPFSPRGVSDIELIAELQEILWELMNQRLDNIELINNAITLIRSDVDDPEAFEYYPGAKWPVESPDQVAPFQPPYQLAGVTLQAEALLKGDLQNVTSAAPFAGGAETATVDQKTATGASIVMSAAQKRLASKKYQSQQSLKQEAWQRLKNCQQFIDDKKLIHVVGPDGQVDFREIETLAIQGEYIVELEPMSDSMQRQEKRAEALQLGQVLMQMAPLAAAAGSPLNVQEILRWMLKKWEILDMERFFSQQPQPAVMGGQPGGPPGGPNAAGAPPSMGPNMGITSDTAVDAGSPSTTGGASLSPEMMMARARSLTGGGANA